MIGNVKIENLGDMLEFLRGLNEDQLKKKIFVLVGENPKAVINAAVILECDYINPSTEVAEPITDYLPGGEFYLDSDGVEADISGEAIVARKGEVYFFSE